MKKGIRKLLPLVCLAVLAVSLMNGCGNSSGEPANTNTATEYRDEIHIAVNAVPETFDLVHTTSTAGSMILQGSVFELLMALDSTYRIKPELAESCEISEDAMTYTYKLRTDVVFHNGDLMTADDVIASMNRWIDAFSSVGDIAGENRFVKESDDTVSITFDKPYLYLNEMITTGSQRPIIVPASVIEAADPDTGIINEFIGTGPYEFTEWATDRYILLTRFDGYVPYGTEGDADGWYGYKTAATEKVYYDIVTDTSTRSSGIQTGEYDFSYLMSLDDYGIFNDPSSYTIQTECRGQLVMIYNKKAGIASNPLIRQAVNAALNNTDILKAAYVEDEFVQPDGSLMLVKESEWYTQAGTEYYNQNDPERAKELLEEAGYDGEEFNIVVSSAYQDFYNAALVIEQNLKTAGVNVVLTVVDWATYLSMSKDETAFDAFITSVSIKMVPTQLYYMSESAGWTTLDPKIVELKTTIDSSANKADAIAAWQELQEYMWSEAVPVSMLGKSFAYSVSSSKVKNLIYFEGPHCWNVLVEK